MMAAKLKEADLICQLNECKEKLLIAEQQVTYYYHYHYYYFFKPSVKNTRRWSKKLKDIVVAGMNTNAGGVPT